MAKQVQNPGELFTPYDTTKSEGSGIGLVFCQQVAEAHGGALSLSNRDEQQGCVATLILPYKQDS